jgi:hypothetical protein
MPQSPKNQNNLDNNATVTEIMARLQEFPQPLYRKIKSPINEQLQVTSDVLKKTGIYSAIFIKQTSRRK